MGILVTGPGAGASDDSLTVVQSMRRAWVTWLVLLVAPFGLFLATVWDLMYGGTVGSVGNVGNAGDARLAQVWFVSMMVYMLVVVPGAFFVRSRIFRAFWAGRGVSPNDYYRGMTVAWLAVEFGGIGSLLGCLVTHTLLPNLLPGLVAFVVFLTLSPSGRAMTRPVGNVDDPGVYEDPS